MPDKTKDLLFYHFAKNNFRIVEFTAVYRNFTLIDV